MDSYDGDVVLPISISHQTNTFFFYRFERFSFPNTTATTTVTTITIFQFSHLNSISFIQFFLLLSFHIKMSFSATEMLLSHSKEILLGLSLISIVCDSISNSNYRMQSVGHLNHWSMKSNVFGIYQIVRPELTESSRFANRLYGFCFYICLAFNTMSMLYLLVFYQTLSAGWWNDNILNHCLFVIFGSFCLFFG